MMDVKQLHSWQVSVAEAKEIQRQLASQVLRQNEIGTPRYVAGADISAPNQQGLAKGAVVVLSYPQLQLEEVRIAEEKPAFPYVPGLLSFRESPLILKAWETLSIIPDLLLVDGQGIAHPRRMGLASHLGLLLDLPSIGCAKSLLLGSHDELGEEAGSWCPLTDGGEIIGAVLRSQAEAKPLYISIGHKIDLETALHWVKACLKGYRLPEPARLAHLAASGHLSEGLVNRAGQDDSSRKAPSVLESDKTGILNSPRR